MTSPLPCQECSNPARWHVWYKDCELLLANGANLAYRSLCDDHAIQDLQNGRDGYEVDCMRLVANQFLPEGDRAK